MPGLQYLILCDDKSLCIVRRSSINDKNTKLVEGQRISFMWPEDGSSPRTQYHGQIIQSSTKEAILQIVKERKIKDMETEMNKNKDQRKDRSRKPAKVNECTETRGRKSEFPEKQGKKSEDREKQGKKSRRADEPETKTERVDRKNDMTERFERLNKRKNEKDPVTSKNKKTKTDESDTSAKSKTMVSLKKKSESDMAKSIFKFLNVEVDESVSNSEKIMDVTNDVEPKDDSPMEVDCDVKSHFHTLRDIQDSLNNIQTLVKGMLSDERLTVTGGKPNLSHTTVPSRRSRSSTPVLSIQSPVNVRTPNLRNLFPPMERSYSLSPESPFPSTFSQLERDGDKINVSKHSTPESQYRSHGISSTIQNSSRFSPEKRNADRIFENSLCRPQLGRSSGQSTNKVEHTLPHQQSDKSLNLENPVESKSSRNIGNTHSASSMNDSVHSDDEDNSWTLQYTNGVENKVVELIPGTDIYVSKITLSLINRTAKGQKQMARQLLDAIFTRDALRSCSLSGRRAKGLGKGGLSRPGLHKEAQTVLIEYVQNTAATQRWPPVADQLIVQSLRAKLNEIRDTGKLNQKMEKN